MGGAAATVVFVFTALRCHTQAPHAIRETRQRSAYASSQQMWHHCGTRRALEKLGASVAPRCAEPVLASGSGLQRCSAGPDHALLWSCHRSRRALPIDDTFWLNCPGLSEGQLHISQRACISTFTSLQMKRAGAFTCTPMQSGASAISWAALATTEPLWLLSSSPQISGRSWPMPTGCL